MREISCTLITDAVERLCIKAATVLPPDLGVLLECAAETEQAPAGITYNMNEWWVPKAERKYTITP